jgi:hypothetical protein
VRNPKAFQCGILGLPFVVERRYSRRS